MCGRDSILFSSIGQAVWPAISIRIYIRMQNILIKSVFTSNEALMVILQNYGINQRYLSEVISDLFIL